MATIQKITPNFWYDKAAEDAARFYVSIFKNASVGHISYYGKEGFEIHKMPEGTAMTVDFTLDGQNFRGLNGGPLFKFYESVSFVVSCDTQEELDYYWDKLNEGGDPKAQQCGWLKDKFGMSWQIVPAKMDKWMTTGTKEQTSRVMTVMLQMKKLDIAKLEEAFNG